MKEFEQYGKMREPRRYKKKREEIKMEKENNKEELEKPKGFLELFNGKEVEIHLVTGELLEGQLDTNNYNKFDLLLHTSNGVILLPKHAVAFITMKEAKE